MVQDNSARHQKGCNKPLWNIGEPGGARTRDHRIKSAMLYQLSYRPMLLNYNYLTTSFHFLRICLTLMSDPVWWLRKTARNPNDGLLNSSYHRRFTPRRLS